MAVTSTQPKTPVEIIQGYENQQISIEQGRISTIGKTSIWKEKSSELTESGKLFLQAMSTRLSELSSQDSSSEIESVTKTFLEQHKEIIITYNRKSWWNRAGKFFYSLVGKNFEESKEKKNNRIRKSFCPHRQRNN